MGNALSDPASNPLISLLVLGASPQGGQNLAALQSLPYLRQKMGLENEAAKLSLGQAKYAAGLQSDLMGGYSPDTGITWNQGMSPEQLADKYPGLAGAGGPNGVQGAGAALLPEPIRSLFVPTKNVTIDGGPATLATLPQILQLRSQGHTVAETGAATQPAVGEGQTLTNGPNGPTATPIPGYAANVRANAIAKAAGEAGGRLPFAGPTAQATAAGTLAGNPSWGAPINTFDAKGNPITVQTNPGGGVRQPILNMPTLPSPKFGGAGGASTVANPAQGGNGANIGNGGVFRELSPGEKAAQEASAKTATETNYKMRDAINAEAQKADEDLPLFNMMQNARKVYTGGGWGGEFKGDALKALQSYVPQGVLDKAVGGDKAAAFQVIQAGAAKLASDLRSQGQRVTQQEIMNLYLPAAGGASMSNNAASALFATRISNAQKWQKLRDIANEYTDESGAIKPGFYNAVQGGLNAANREQASIGEQIAKNKFNFGPVNVAASGKVTAGAAEPFIPAGTRSATGPNGQKLYLINGKWQ